MRFLLEGHGLGEPEGELEQALAQLEGWAAPVAVWEQGLLASRCTDYSPQRLDEQFLSGFLTWFRSTGNGQGAQQLVAATPVTIVPRRKLAIWRPGMKPEPERLGSVAERIREALLDGGATFAVELEERTGLMQNQLEQGLAELVAQGVVTADAFSPLRWLIRPDSEKRRLEKRLSRRRIGAAGGRGSGLLGRWSIMAAGDPQREATLFPQQARLAALCEALLLRYGVVFRAVLERETALPPWRQLLRYLRRMEDRGEVHGGWRLEGFSDKQFALPEAVGLLRRCAGKSRDRRLVVVTAADPLNLGGIITPGVKTAVRPGNRILLLNGLPVARLQGDQLELLGRNQEIASSEAERYLRSVRSFPRAAAGQGASVGGALDS